MQVLVAPGGHTRVQHQSAHLGQCAEPAFQRVKPALSSCQTKSVWHELGVGPGRLHHLRHSWQRAGGRWPAEHSPAAREPHRGSHLVQRHRQPVRRLLERRGRCRTLIAFANDRDDPTQALIASPNLHYLTAVPGTPAGLGLFTDGVLTQNATTFTSATAAFTQADVGRLIRFVENVAATTPAARSTSTRCRCLCGTATACQLRSSDGDGPSRLPPEQQDKRQQEVDVPLE